jgi:hypothetical protein
MIRPSHTDKPVLPRKMCKDLRTLIQFIDIYCHGCHKESPRSQVKLKSHDVNDLYGKDVELCDDCVKLLTHALVKRCICPQDLKPQCKHCPNHCYHPKYRSQIQEAMKYSGRKLVMSGRVDMLLRLLF